MFWQSCKLIRFPLNLAIEEESSHSCPAELIDQPYSCSPSPGTCPQSEGVHDFATVEGVEHVVVPGARRQYFWKSAWLTMKSSNSFTFSSLSTVSMFPSLALYAIS